MAIYMRFPNGLKKAFTLSYDDGVRQDKRLVKILDKYGIKATFNINSALFDKDYSPEKTSGRMSEKEIMELLGNSDHEIAIHGLEHGFDDRLHDAPMANEILSDRKNLEKMTSRVIKGMAYPYGVFNDKLVNCLKVCGIAYSRTCITSEWFNMPKDWLRLEPTCHHSNKRVFELCDEFISMNTNVCYMFYMWGHSYEFDFDNEYNNWEHIEKIAEKMGGKDDIWYATNVEIYDYEKAYKSLEVSADSSIIHNPTAYKIWFAVCDHKRDWIEHSIEPGETLKIDCSKTDII